MNTSPLISVCINAYNAQATIRDAVDSVLSQTYTNLQVIVVDDGSDDGTWDVLQSIPDTRLECHRLPQNGHISNANNQALSYVRGDYVAHLDADDRWCPDKLARQLAYLQAHPACGACFTAARMVNEQGDTVEDSRYDPTNLPQAAMLYRLLTVGNYLNHSSVLARREIIEQVGKHDLTLLYFHDYDYWLRMVMLCELHILPEQLVICRLSETSNSAMSDDKLQVHIHEFARILYRAVVNCPASLFKEAFGERLRLRGITHTPEQLELEKAFLLCELFIYLPQNRAVGLRRLCELMNDERYVQTAQEDFGFTVHDLYRLEEQAVYHDERACQENKATIVWLENKVEALSSELGWYKEQTAQLQGHLERVDAHAKQLEKQLADPPVRLIRRILRRER